VVSANAELSPGRHLAPLLFAGRKLLTGRHERLVGRILCLYAGREIPVQKPVQEPFLCPPLRMLLALCALVLGLLIFVPPTSAHAFEKRVYGDVVVESGQTAEEASTVVGSVTVNGLVKDDVGSVSGDILVNGAVGRDIRTAFGRVEVNAPVGGGVESAFGDVYVDSSVDGDVHVSRGYLRLGPGAQISGDVSVGDGTILRERGSVVEGSVTTGMASGFGHSPGGGYGAIPTFFTNWLLAALGFVICSLLLAVVAPGPLSAVVREAEEHPWWSLLLGLASVPAAGGLSVVLAVSVVGIPFLLLLAPAYLALVLFGALVAAYFVGRKLVPTTGRYRAGDALVAAIGASIIAATNLLPSFGNLLLCTLALLGAGAMILAFLSRRRHRFYEPYIRDRRDA